MPRTESSKCLGISSLQRWLVARYSWAYHRQNNTCQCLPHRGGTTTEMPPLRRRPLRRPWLAVRDSWISNERARIVNSCSYSSFRGSSGCRCKCLLLLSREWNPCCEQDDADTAENEKELEVSSKLLHDESIVFGLYVCCCSKEASCSSIAAAALWMRRFSRNCVTLVLFLCRCWLWLSDNMDDLFDGCGDGGVVTTDDNINGRDVFASYSMGCGGRWQCSLPSSQGTNGNEGWFVAIAPIAAVEFPLPVVDCMQILEIVSHSSSVLVVMVIYKR